MFVQCERLRTLPDRCPCTTGTTAVVLPSPPRGHVTHTFQQREAVTAFAAMAAELGRWRDLVVKETDKATHLAAVARGRFLRRLLTADDARQATQTFLGRDADAEGHVLFGRRRLLPLKMSRRNEPRHLTVSRINR